MKNVFLDMIYKKLAILVSLLFLVAHLFAQKEIDSLKLVLKKCNEDTNKVIVLNDISEKFNKTIPDSALPYSQQAVELARSLNYKLGLARAYHFMGVAYYRQEKYTISIDYYLKAIKIFEEINDKHTLLKTYNNIGIIFFQQENYDKAEEYYLASLKIKQELGDAWGIASSYTNLGTVAQNKKAYLSALDYYNKSMAIMEELKNKEGIAKCLNNIGMVYIIMKENKRAIDFLNRALALKTELNDKAGVANTLNNIADIFYGMKQYSSAIETLNKSLMLSKETGSNDYYKSACEKLSTVYAASGNYERAYKYHTIYSSVKDSLLNIAQGKQAAELEAKYENEKTQRENERTQKENAILTKENELSMFRLYAISGGFILVLMLSFVIYSGFRQKQKANQLLSGQNEEISRQNVLIEQKNKDILDSIQYAKRIQEAIYPSKKLVKNYLDESFILFKPKDIISGDFYWMATTENKILFAAVDCTGHGVPGALMSIVGYNGLNQAVNEYKLTKPSDILNHLNKTVNYTLNKSRKEEVMLQDGMDIALCCFDKEKMTLEYAGAYNPLYLVRNKQLTEFKADRHAVGAFIENEIKFFTNNEIPVQKGDIVYIFSDGYADQFGGEQGKKYTYKRLKETLISISDKGMEEQRHELHLTFEKWKASLDQVDDVCLIGVKLV